MFRLSSTLGNNSRYASKVLFRQQEVQEPLKKSTERFLSLQYYNYCTSKSKSRLTIPAIPVPAIIGNSSSFLVQTTHNVSCAYTRDYCSSIAERGVATHIPTPFQKKIFVYSKMYAKEKDIPEKVTRSQLKAAKDKFRIVVAIWFMVVWAISTALIIAYGKRNRSQHIKEESLRVRQQYIDDQRRAQEGK